VRTAREVSRSARVRSCWAHWLCGWLPLLAAIAACGAGERTPAAPQSSFTAGAEQASTARSRAAEAAAQRARADWVEALKVYNAHETQAWDQRQCDDLSHRFERIAVSQAGFAEALYMAGVVQARCGQRDRAQALYQRALADDPKLCKARVAVALDALNARDQRAQEARDQRALDAQAERAFEQAIADDPQCTEGYANLAILQRRKGKVGNAAALANLRRALAIDAQYLPVFNEMALLYLSEADDDKKLDLAEVVCSQATRINPNYAPIYNTWGLIDLRRGKILDASAKFQRAIALDDNLFEAHMNFARIAIGFRGYQDAKVAYERALALQPENFEAQLGLGVALRGLRDNAKAQQAYEKAARLAPQRPEPYYNLGILYQDFQGGSLDEMKLAKHYYEEFLKRAGSDKRYAATVDEIQRRCKAEGKRKQDNKHGCVAGRLQNIQVYLETMQQMQELQRLQQEQDKAAADATHS
jgi:tetratricopeptide (TPR) repeat protein